MKNNILILGNRDSVFVSNFALEIEKQDYSPQILDLERWEITSSNGTLLQKFFPPLVILARIPKIGYRLKLIFIRRMLSTLRGHYQICHIHYNLKIYADLASSISRITDRLVVSVWGSDFFRMGSAAREAQKKIYNRADLITFLTTQTMQTFNDYYSGRYADKTKILRLGLKPLEYIDDIRSENPHEIRSHFGIDNNALIIACGYNGTEAQNHKTIIQSIQSVHSKLPKHSLLLFPMSYGDEKHILTVKKLLEQSSLSHKIITGFLSDEDIARLRTISDIFINIQSTDHLSGSLLEHLYAGSIVISGRWLPYEILDDRGVFQLYIDKPEQIGKKLFETMSKLESYKIKAASNPNIVSDVSRWSVNIVKWDQAYSLLLNNKSNKLIDFKE